MHKRQRPVTARQTLVLFALGIASGALQWTLHLDIPIGVLAMGGGLFVAYLFDPRRLFAPAFILVCVGLLLYLPSYLPVSRYLHNDLPSFLLAVGVGLWLAGIAARLARTGAGTLAAGTTVVVIGVLEWGRFAGLLPDWIYRYLVSSLWGATGLLLLMGLASLVRYLLGRRRQPAPQPVAAIDPGVLG